MDSKFIELLSFSIVIPACTAIIRFNKINSVYFPFILCLWIGLLNEIISYFLLNTFHVSNNINNNIYLLLEAVLFVWLFRKWNLFSSRKSFNYLLNFIVLLWLINIFFISHFTLFVSYFMVGYSFVIVLLSINMMNRIILKENRNLLSSPVFLICISFIVYYTFSVLIEIFWLYGLGGTNSFTTNIYRIMGYVNLVINLIYAVAILWMPMRQEFTLP